MMESEFEFLRGLAHCEDKEQMARYIQEHEQKPMTNADRIRAMTDEELADECDEKVRTYDLPKEVRGIWMSGKMKLRDAWLKWLQQPCAAVQPITERPDGQT